MLMAIRHKAQGWIAWVIVTLLIVPFALWGINSYFTATVDDSVAKVNGEEISERDLQRAYQQQRDRMAALFGENFNPAMINEELMRKEVLDRLVNDEVVLQEVSRSGFYVSNAQVTAEVHKYDIFQMDGKFDLSLYKQQLRVRGMTPSGFEYQIRRSLLPAQLYSGIEGSAFSSKGELEKVIKLRNQTRDFRYFTLSAASAGKSMELSEGEIQGYYDNNQVRFQDPEKVQLDYIELKIEDFMAEIEVDEDEVKRQYEDRQSDFGVEEERRASHIMIEIQDGNEAVARDKANELLALIKAGGDFAELARQHSEDPGSAGEGGDLDFFTKGTMGDAFDDVVFQMTSNAVSDIVRIDEALHIIKLTAIRGGEVKPYAEVRSKLVQDYRRNQAEGRYLGQIEDLQNVAYENPDSLTIVAETLGLTVARSGLITRRGGEGIGKNADIRTTAFSAEVLDGANSELIEITPEHAMVVRVFEHHESQTKPLSEVRSQVEQALRIQKARDWVREQGEKYLTEAKSVDIAQVAQQNGLQLQSVKDAKRDAGKIDQEIQRKAFQIARPSSQSSLDTVILRNGDFVVISIDAVNEPEGVTPDSDKSAMTQTLARMGGTAEIGAMIGAMRNRAAVSDRLAKIQ